MTTQTETSSGWSLVKKLLFRLFFCYYVLYLFPFPLNYIPFGAGEYISSQVDAFWHWLVLPVARNIFHITGEIPIQGWGSGDTTFRYIQLFVRLCLAVFGMLIWTVLDRDRKNYALLFRYLIVVLRYFLALAMLGYGLAKFFANQFGELALFDLIKTYGDSSPMGLLWRFMKSSGTYQMFTGAVEILGGVLLLFRRTVRAGALVCLGGMTNVFILNMSYDIPVKLGSVHYMCMALFILLPDVKNMARFFVWNKPAPPVRITPYFKKKSWNMTGRILKGIILGGLLIIYVRNGVERLEKYGEKAPVPPLYGIYEVQHFIRNNDTLPPLKTDISRWDRLIIDKDVSLIIKMDNKREMFKSETDTTNRLLKLIPYEDTIPEYSFRYSERDSMFFLEGMYKRDSLQIRSHKKNRNDFLLINRGFHWINEMPYGR